MGFRVCFLGAGRYHQPLDATTAKKFRCLSHLGELFVIGFSRNLHGQKFTEYAHFYLMPQLPIPLLRYMEIFTIGAAIAFWLVLRHGVHTLVVQSPHEGFAAAIVKTLAGKFGRKVVLIVESHGDFEESVFLQRYILLPWLYRFVMRRVAAFTLRQADLLRAVSNSTRLQLERWISEKPIVQFPAWTDIESFLEDSTIKEDCGFQDIIYAGVLIPLKGVHHLIEAFGLLSRDLPHARLTIIGREDNPAYAVKLKGQIRKLGLDARVQFIEEVSQQELAARMRRGQVFVLPTYSEGLPRVVFEAMATGLPVVASAVSGIPEVVMDGVTGFLVAPGDENALTQRLQWILEHPKEAQEMGVRARAFAEKFFSTETYVASYRQVFEKAQALLAS